MSKRRGEAVFGRGNVTYFKFYMIVLVLTVFTLDPRLLRLFNNLPALLTYHVPPARTVDERASPTERAQEKRGERRWKHDVRRRRRGYST